MSRLRATTPIVLAIATACGSIVSEPPDASDAAVDVATVDDALDAVADAACAQPCPSDPPQPGTPCSTTSRTCEYAPADASCRVAFTCEGAGTWSLAQMLTTLCEAADAASTITATPGCPVPRPLVGSACSPNGTVCTNYFDLACTPQLACRDCVWRVEYIHTCP